MAHNSQITSFSGPLYHAMGPLLPFVAPPRLKTLGAIIGRYLIGPPEPFCWDTHGFIRDGYTTRPTIRIYGDVGFGKSLLAKVIAYEGGMIFKNKQTQRIYADNHRQLDGIDEYARLASLYGSSTKSITTRINLFDPDVGLSASDHLETAVSIYESYNNNEPPRGHMKLAMRVAIREMFEAYEKNPSPDTRPCAELFAQRLLQLNRTDAIRHIAQVITVAREEDEAIIKAETEWIEETVGATSDDDISTADMSVELAEHEYDTSNIDWEQFKKDAGFVAQSIIGALDGEFGETFGGNSSFANDFEGGFAGINFSNKNELTIAAIVSHVMRIKRAAEINRDPRFIFGVEIMDENPSLWRIPTFARTQAKRLKYARGEGTEIIQIAQRPQDFYSVGDAGSQVQTLAVNSRRDIGIEVYTAIQDAEAAEELRVMNNWTPFECEMIQNLNRGQYAVSLSGLDHLVFFELDRNPFRKWLGETNEALFSALNRSA